MPQAKAAWDALLAAADVAKTRRIAGLFEQEPVRLNRLTLEAAGLLLDLSKQPWSLADVDLALALARAADVPGARARLFAGEPVNRSEGRAALHMALRAADGEDWRADGVPVSRDVEATRAAMRDFAEAVGSGAKRGQGGFSWQGIDTGW